MSDDLARLARLRDDGELTEEEYERLKGALLDSQAESSSPLPPGAKEPGWLRDPEDRARFRYWDGSQWTEQYRATVPDDSKSSGRQSSGNDSNSAIGWGIALALFPFILVFAFCGGDSDDPNPASSRSPVSQAPRSTNAVAEMSALEQMEIAFVGGYTQSEIKQRLETAMQLYSLPITEENHSRAGSALVALRKDFGPAEMDILDHMIRSHVPGIDVSFADAAGLSAASILLGDS